MFPVKSKLLLVALLSLVFPATCFVADDAFAASKRVIKVQKKKVAVKKVSTKNAQIKKVPVKKSKQAPGLVVRGPAAPCLPTNPEVAAAAEAIPVFDAPGLRAALTSSQTASVKLCRNINLAGTDVYNLYPGSVYQQSLGFGGRLSGQGYEIQNYGVNPIHNGSTAFSTMLGLFTSLDGAVIENIKFANVAIENDHELTDTGRAVVAGTARNAVFTNVHVSGRIRLDDDLGTGAVVGRAFDTQFNNIRVDAVIFGDYSVGGVVGEMFNSSVDGARVAITIPEPRNADGSYEQFYPYRAGGIAALASASVIRNVAVQAQILAGGAAGGIVGVLTSSSYLENATVSNSTIAGSVDAVIRGGREADLVPVSTGGLVGRITGFHANAEGEVIRRSSVSASIIRGKYAGGALGEIEPTVTSTLGLPIHLEEIGVSNAQVSALWNTGGLIGVAYGTEIRNCIVQAVTLNSLSYASQTIRRVGGYVGNRRARILNSIFEGTLTPQDQIVNRVFTGPFLAFDSTVEDSTGRVANSYYNAELMPAGNGYGEARTGSQLRNERDSYAGNYNFVAIWRFVMGSLPHLRALEQNAADFNLDGVVTPKDIASFLDAYFAGDLAADTDGNGTVSLQDLFNFLGRYFLALS